MPRLLLLATTTSYRAGAFLDAAHTLGVSVTVGSDRAQALAAMNPAGHLVLDFRDLESAARAIQDFAIARPIDAILAADDDGVLLAAEAAGRLGLAHASRDAVTIARDKRRFRQRLAASGVPSPWFELLDSEADPDAVSRTLSYPCVVKPAALSASRGVIRADDPPAFVVAFRRTAELLAREQGAGAHPMIVERYMPGVEVAFEGLVTGGVLRTLALFDKPDTLEGPFFEETIYVTPSRLPAVTREAVVSRVVEVVGAIGLTHGPIHAELRVNPAGVWPLEIAPRPIGGLCSRTLRFGEGLSLETLLVRHALGEDVGGLERETDASGVMMIPIPGEGVLLEVGGVEAARKIPGIEEVRITIPIGDRVVPLPEGARYLGFLFARDPSAARVEDALRESHRLLRVIVQPTTTPGEASASWSR